MQRHLSGVPAAHAGARRAWAPPKAALKDKSSSSLSLSVALGQADISVVDHMPEELLNLTLSGLRLEYASGIGPEGTFDSFRLSVASLQLDDQLPFSRCTYTRALQMPPFSSCNSAN